MRWPIHIRLPSVFGWASLAFADRLKLLAILFQAGAGIAMTIMAGYALWNLAHLKAVWPVFYLGAGALALIGVVTTGFGALLYKRTVEFEAFGTKFKAQDQEGAAVMAQQMKEITNVQRANFQDNERGVDRPIVGNAGTVVVQERGDQQPEQQAEHGQQDNRRPERGPDNPSG